MNALKAKIQIKKYQEKIKVLRDKIKKDPDTILKMKDDPNFEPSGEGEFKNLNDAVMKGGKSLESIVKGGLKAKGNRRKSVVKTYATPPVLPAMDPQEPMRFRKF